MTWKLVKTDETEECEHEWHVKGAHGDAGNTYINYECFNCDTEKEIQLAMDSVASQWYSFNEPVVNVCIHCNEKEGNCECYKCPVCEKVTQETYEDGVCEHCICEWCHDNHGCGVLKCSQCGDEYACENNTRYHKLEENYGSGMCEICYDDSKASDKVIQEKADALKEKAEALLEEAKRLEKMI